MMSNCYKLYIKLCFLYILLLNEHKINLLVIHLKSVAETAFDMVSPGPSVRHRKHKKGSGRSRYNQPADIREGVTNAIMLVKEVSSFFIASDIISLYDMILK